MMGPNLFLLSAPRAGSTQLARWLGSHSDITLSAVKEPNFFSAHEFPPEIVGATHLNDIDPGEFARGPQNRPRQFAVFRRAEDYAALFDRMTTRWRIDASTSYLACPEAPAAIRAFAPRARLIFLTRDPVERALSHYRLARRTGRTMDSLGQVLRHETNGDLAIAEQYLLRPSAQVNGIARFQRLFPPNQCLKLEFASLFCQARNRAGQNCRMVRYRSRRIRSRH